MTSAHPLGVDVTTRSTEGRTLCRCVMFHHPMPAEDEGHHTIPKGAPFHGDPHQPLLWLCPTAHSAVHAAIRVHLKARKLDRAPTKLELRPYTKYVRKLAEQAMDALGPQADMPLDP